MEYEAQEAIINLNGITEDIILKTQRYQSRILDD